MYETRPQILEKIIKLLKENRPELLDNELEESAQKHFDLAKFLVQLWVRDIKKSSKDPPK